MTAWCRECHGAGWLTDGTTAFPCPDCNPNQSEEVNAMRTGGPKVW